MKTKLFLLTTAAALSCSLATLHAEDAPKPPPPPSGDGAPPPPPGGGQPGQPGGDRNQRMEEIFKRIDTNGDGKISKEEFIEYSKKEAEDRFAKMDEKATGALDKTAFEEAMRKLVGRRGGGEGGERPRGATAEGFRRPDSTTAGTGGDGSGFRPRPGGDGANPPAGSGGGNPPAGGDGGGRRRGGFGGGGGTGGGGGSAIGELFRKVQENGSVSKEEFQKMSDESFKRFDTNGDGKITKEELDAVMQSFRGGAGGGAGGPPAGGAPGGAGGAGGGARRPPGAGGGTPPPQNN